MLGAPIKKPIRGYTMEKYETMEIYISQPGNYIVDGKGNVIKQDS